MPGQISIDEEGGGYRFALRQMLLPLECRRGERLTIECCVDNVGCAPIYRP